MAMTRPTAEEAAAWVEESVAAQGVPVKVTDRATIEEVAVLLREGRQPKKVKDAKRV